MDWEPTTNAAPASRQLPESVIVDASTERSPGLEGVRRAVNTLLCDLPARSENHDGLSAFQARRRTVKNGLDDLQAVLQAFQDEVSVRRVALSKEHNAMAPIHQLPVELLATIFAESLLKDKEPSLREGDDRTQRVALLCEVATRWWDIIKEVPSLWTTIELGRGHVALALERSKDIPIDIKGVAVLQYKKAAPRMDRYIPLVGDHVQRWGSLRWIGDAAMLQNILTSSPLPTLQVLDLEHRSANPTLRQIPFTPTPQLRELRLRNISIPWTSEPLLPNLRRFSLSELPLEELPSAKTLLALWASCPALEEFELSDLGYARNRNLPPIPPQHPPPLPHEIASFPALKSIQLNKITEPLLLDLLRVIHAPNLVRMKLDMGLDDNLREEMVLRALAAKIHGETLLHVACKNTAELSGELSVTLAICALEIERSRFADDPRGRIFVQIPGFDWTDRMDEVIDFLSLDTITLPLTFGFHHRDGEDLEPEDIDPRFLNRLPGIREISISDEYDIPTVLNYLSTGAQGDEGEEWPCANLAEIHLRVSRLSPEEGEECLDAVRKMALHRPTVEIYGQVHIQDRVRYHSGVTSFLGIDFLAGTLQPLTTDV